MKENELLLLRLVELMFDKQQTFLLLDELYEDEIVGSYIRNIQIDSPYQQLLFEGVLSQFSQGEELVVSITVENYFHHLLGLILQKDDRYQSSESLIQLVKSNNLKGVKEGVSNLLSFDVEVLNFDRITQLIDLSEGDEAILGICVLPVINALQIFGIKEILDLLLKSTSENDYSLLLKVLDELELFQLHQLKSDLKIQLINKIQILSTYSVLLFLESLYQVENDLFNKNAHKLIEVDKHRDQESEVLFKLLKVKNHRAEYDYCISLCKRMYKQFPKIDSKLNAQIQFILAELLYRKGDYVKCEEILTTLLPLESSESFKIKLFNLLGDLYQNIGDYESSLKYHTENLNLKETVFGKNHIEYAYTINNIGVVYYSQKKYNLALDMYVFCKDIREKIVNPDDVLLSNSYGNLGDVYLNLNDFNNAEKYYIKSLENRLLNFGESHPYVASSFLRVGDVSLAKNNFEGAKINFSKSLKIRISLLGKDHPLLASNYLSFGKYYLVTNHTKKAILNLKRGINIENKTYGDSHEHTLVFHELLIKAYSIQKDSVNALKFTIKSAEIRKEKIGLEDEATKDAISNAIRLAKELDKENELPEWIKNTN